MITDMNRLERAARLSMGDFEIQPQAPPPRRAYPSPRVAAPLAILAALAIAIILFG